MSTSTIEVRRCDRCGATVEKRLGSDVDGWAKLGFAQDWSPTIDDPLGLRKVLIGSRPGVIVDLCNVCADEITAWWAEKAQAEVQP